MFGCRLYWILYCEMQVDPCNAQRLGVVLEMYLRSSWRPRAVLARQRQLMASLTLISSQVLLLNESTRLLSLQEQLLTLNSTVFSSGAIESLLTQR
jgi:hypothetical protein